MFHIIDERFFVPLASPNKLVYWECICKLFSVMDHQLSFGVDRDVVVEELIPEANLSQGGHSGTLGVMTGFLMMMILDVALG